jgi:hypothetical protein
MALISAPAQQEFIDETSVRDGLPMPSLLASVRLTPAWTTFFSNAYQILLGITQSGTTAQRPVKFLYVGRMFFDTSLGARGKPIWVASVSAGVAVWIDSASNIV